MKGKDEINEEVLNDRLKEAIRTAESYLMIKLHEMVKNSDECLVYIKIPAGQSIEIIPYYRERKNPVGIKDKLMAGFKFSGTLETEIKRLKWEGGTCENITKGTIEINGWIKLGKLHTFHPGGVGECEKNYECWTNPPQDWKEMSPRNEPFPSRDLIQRKVPSPDINKCCPPQQGDKNNKTKVPVTN